MPSHTQTVFAPALTKVFDTGKNKLEESKGWAVGEVAQEIRAHLFALTHNFLVLLRRHLDVSAGEKAMGKAMGSDLSV